ncbi:histidine kinase [Halostagnicola sp. A56]|uniref:PAS domain-containing sensor histidine kinase n=1 Tax=Halostagnicola sp. A56 TaxID=1495067 RepID=UPI0004A04366|nr:PAS domain-containing protein [Halostagnicola sp. A56]KDE60043.1 histidine kinase [Halostagnicola sp. A56]
MASKSIPPVDRVTDAFFALDSGFRFTYINERAQALLKRSRGELIGRVMWDELPRTIETQFPDGFYRAMDEQIPVSFEVYHTRLETWFEARAYPSEDGLSVFMRDITERKDRETKLAQNAAVVESIRDGVIVLDNGNRIVSVNEAVEANFRIDRSALLGEHVDTLPELASIDDEHALEIGRSIDDVAIGAADFRELEVPFTDLHGNERICELRLVPIEDERANVAGIIRDVTKQRAHDQIIESLHELTRWLFQSEDPDEICSIAVHAGSDLLELPISGIWLLDDTQGYLDPVAGTAKAHDEFGGLPRFRPGEGLAWDVYESGELEYYDDLNEVEDLYNPATPLQSEIIAPVGTHGVLMTGSFEPNRFDESDLDLVSTLVENTTVALDRAEQDQLLRERTEQLERQTERLEAVANVLSNDIKEQIRTISDALEIERAEASGVSISVPDESVEATLGRTEQLVDDVREFARNSRSVGMRTLIDLRTAAEDALERSELDPMNLEIETDATLRADDDRFGRLLESVFDDVAARSTAETTVRMGAIDADEDSDSVRGFFVADDAETGSSGPRDRLLDPVGPEDLTLPGLGLVLARVIAEAHDWTITVETTDSGEGTRIEFRDITTFDDD